MALYYYTRWGVVRRIILAFLPLREAQVKSRYLRQGASARSKHVGTECAQLQAFGLSVIVSSVEKSDSRNVRS